MAKSRFVHIVDDVPAITAADRLTMVVSLDGFVDAGNASSRAARHLLESSAAAPVVATFDVDAFHDYRARRPLITFSRDHFEDYDAPRLVVRLLRDAGDEPYLLLQGPEPDNRWEAFAKAVREVVERLGVTRVVSMGGIATPTPHSRPLRVTHHANNPDLVHEVSPFGQMRVPSSAQSLLELRLGEWGHDMDGFVVHVPHYLGSFDYPQAALALLQRLDQHARVTVDLAIVRDEAAKREQEITDYLSEHEEVAEVVRALESQYEAFERAEASESNLLAPNQPLPTAEDLGREFEQFLAGLNDEGDANA